jgi:3-methyladenine DNA glycosylase AlkD
VSEGLPDGGPPLVERWRRAVEAARDPARAAGIAAYMRKAIGWALRSYAKTAPDAVAAFLAPPGGEPLLVARWRRAVEAARDPARAAAAAAYMRHQFAFAGVNLPRLTAIHRETTASLPPPVGDADLAGLALACWALPEREYRYLAVMHLRRHARRLGPAFVPVLERLVTAGSWWDTVDGLATGVAGPLVSAHPELRAVMDRWVEAENVWLARVAILHQERWKERTDPGVLFAYCRLRAGDREFFVRKAIGWALRSYAKTAPDAVAAFLAAHGGELSGLSRREAERGVEMGRRRITRLAG